MTLWDTLQQIAGEHGSIVKIAAVVFAVVLVNLAVRLVLGQLRRRARRSHNPWDDAVLEALGRPLRVLAWAIGLLYATRIAFVEGGKKPPSLLDPLQYIVVVAVLAWFLFRLIHNLEAVIVARSAHREEGMDRTTIEAISKLLRLTVVITAALMILQTLGFSISGVLAFGGIGGIAVGFAAKDLLANFFGGLMIYLDRPFAVGDWIYSPDREIEGTVEKIGWRLTTIRTFDKRPLYVPNATFTSIAVVNPSRMTHRRIYETIGIRYDDLDKMAAICADVEAMLRAHPDIDATQTLMVHFNAFNSSSVDFFVYTFTKTTVWTEYHRIKQDVLLKIHAIIAEHGAQEAFPTRTVHLPEGVRLVPPELAGHPQVEGGEPPRHG